MLEQIEISKCVDFVHLAIITQCNSMTMPQEDESCKRARIVLLTTFAKNSEQKSLNVVKRKSKFY